MSVDLESQIRQIADAAFDETTAVDVDRRPLVVAGPSAGTINNKEDVMLRPTPEPTPTSRRTRMLAVAASAAVIIAGILAIALLRDGSDQAPADPSVPPTTVDTAAATVDTEALAAVGERLITAFDNRDRATVDELVADDANPASMFGTTSKSGLLDAIGYIEAADVEFSVRECVGSEPDQVQCTIFQRSGFATAAGVGPGPATMLMKIEDGRVTALRYGRPEGHGRAHELFSGFIRDSNPDDVTKMWWSTSTGEPYALLTEESFELFRKYTQEFAESRR